MRKLRARLGLARGEDAGFTLVEMLVTMIVFGLAMGLVTKAVGKVERFANDAQGSADANGEVRLDGVAPGGLTLRVEKDGFEPVELPVAPHASQPIAVLLRRGA